MTGTGAADLQPFGDDVAVAGEKAPACDQIEDLIRLLLTIRKRWGNTAVKFKVSWGGSALWAQDTIRMEIEKLQRMNKRLTTINKNLKAKVKK